MLFLQDVVAAATRERTNSFSSGGIKNSAAAEGQGDMSGRGDTLRMSGSNLHTNNRQMKDLFHRVVALEQRGRQLELLCQSLRTQIRDIRADPKQCPDDIKWEHIGRNCQGKFVWKISHFSDFHNKMRLNHSFVLYSRGFYTNPFGYKVLLRDCVLFLVGT